MLINILQPISITSGFHFNYMMRKFSIALLFILLSAGTLRAQQVIYSQAFENTANLFQDYVLSNLDKGDPAGADFDTLKTVPWYVTTAGAAGNHAAVGTSNYDPATAADDWFITPAIRVGQSPKITWKSLQLTAGTTDTYQVYISTSEQSVAGCLFNGPASSFTSGSAAFVSNTLDLTNTPLVNNTIFIGFRLNTTSGGDKLAIDDITVTELATQFKSLTFTVNMSKYIADSLFNPSKDTVDVAGTFNNFEGTRNILSVVPGTDSSQYSITIPGFLDADRLEFKFRINSTWNDSIVEFPYGQPNRVWNIEPGKYTYTCFYNDEMGTTFGIPETELMSHVNIYPNPAQTNVTVETPANISRMILVSLTGSKILTTGIQSGNAVNMDVSSLSEGAYILLFYTSQGFAGSKKLIIN